MKNKLTFAIVTFFFSISKVDAGDFFSCQVAEGVHKSFGTVHLKVLSKSDPDLIIGKVFRVNRTTGEVFGNYSLFI